MKYFSGIICLFMYLLFGQNSLAQGVKTDSVSIQKSTPKILTISAELRLRAEYRHGYKNLYPLTNPDTTGAFFIGQRTRINLDFTTKHFDFYASLQDVRVWGQQDTRFGTTTPLPADMTTFPLYLFEIYAEPHFNDNWSLRLGRQRIIYDNERLFSENDWRNTSVSHDAARLIYVNNKKNVQAEFTGAFNQFGENYLTTNYKPNGFLNYKVLGIQFLKWKIDSAFSLTFINAMDGYQSSVPGDYKTTYMRFTSGGRVEFTHQKIYATIAAYYQYGKDSSGYKLSAYYFQPEIRYTAKTFSSRLGLEYMSGNNGENPFTTDHSFVTLYGTNHKFNGSLDLLASFPKDIGNAGLINPYIFLYFTKNKWTVQMQNHLFYLQNNYVYAGNVLKKYLGYENDWKINYKANSFTLLEFGFSWAKVSNTMVIVKNPKAPDPAAFSTTPYFGYMMVKFTPVIGKISMN